MTHPDAEVQKAFDAIRALAAGETVPPPPKYYDDAGDDMDIARAMGWVDHALFAPDMEDDSVLTITLYRPAREAVVEVPSHNMLAKDGQRIDLDPEIFVALQTASQACMRVLSETPAGLPYPDTKTPLTRRVRPEAGEKAVAALTAVLESFGGRLDGDGEWPKHTSTHVRAAERVMERLLKDISDDTLRVRVVSRLAPVQAVVYPTVGGDARSREAAAYTLILIGNAIERIGTTYRRQDQHVRDARAAEERAARQRDEITTLRQTAIATYGAALHADGGPAALAILAHLRDGKPLPAYKSTPKYPNPARDALVDALTDALGAEGKGILRDLLGSDMARSVAGTRALVERLDAVYAAPSPAAP